MDGGFRFEIVGPQRAWAGERPIDLGPAKQRAVLGVLLLQAGRPVPTTQIIDAVWPHDLPENAPNVLQKYVAALRRVLEPDRSPRAPSRLLTLSEAGYRLAIDPAQVDVTEFEARIDAATAAHAAGRDDDAADGFRAGLRLWKGEPFAGLSGPLFEAVRVRLGERRVSASEALAEIRLRRGDHRELIAELTALVEEFPLHERLRLLLMLGLYRGGRPTDALLTFRELRTLLDDEHGIEPGEDLQDLQRRILRSDPTLAPSFPSPAVPGSGPFGSFGSPAAPGSFGSPGSLGSFGSSGSFGAPGLPGLPGSFGSSARPAPPALSSSALTPSTLAPAELPPSPASPVSSVSSWEPVSPAPAGFETSVGSVSPAPFLMSPAPMRYAAAPDDERTPSPQPPPAAVPQWPPFAVGVDPYFGGGFHRRPWVTWVETAFGVLATGCTLSSLAFVPILYYAGRRRSRPLFVAAAGYFALAVTFWTLIATVIDEDGTGPAWTDAVMVPIVALVSVAGPIHVLLLNEHLRHLWRRRRNGPIDRRERARRLLINSPRSRIDLAIGRPDLPQAFDDGGLIDVNAVPEHVLFKIPGLRADLARRIIAERDEHGPFASMLDLAARCSLRPDVTSPFNDRLLFLPLMAADLPSRADRSLTH